MCELKRILLVDDDEDIRQVAEMALETVGGFQVLSCETADAALAALASFKPDLLLLDVMLPGTDGPAALAALGRDPHTRAIPVIFLTAEVRPQQVQHYRDLGAVDVIAKPFDPIGLPDRVRAIWLRCRSQS